MKTIHKSDETNFTAMKFVLSARAKDDVKPVFTKLYVEIDEEKNEKILICTDSRRMHFLKTENEDNFFGDLKAGFYDVVKNDSKEIVLNESDVDGQFPNWKQVVPIEKFCLRSSQLTITKERLRETAIIYRDFYKNFPDCSLCLNPEFIKDALINYYECSIFFVKSTAENKPVYESPVIIDYNEKLKAVIMPLLKF